MIEIESGIPLPPSGSSRSPWKDMEIGDSFLVLDGERKNIRQQATNMGKKLSQKFTVRVVEGGGLRVWRTA